MSLSEGMITFLFTDIEGSTQLWEKYPEEMRAALAYHDALLRETIQANSGVVFKTIGDAFCAAFTEGADALHAALTAQVRFNRGEHGFHGEKPGKQPENPSDLLTTEGESPTPPSMNSVINIRVRMALHTGAAEERDGDYFGPTLNRTARLLSIAHGGQTLLSQNAADLVRDQLPPGCALRDMHAHRLKDLQQPEHVFQLLHVDLPADFPPLRSLRNTNLPVQPTSFIGREQELREVQQLLETSRLLTLVGAGGGGKTRLALQAATEQIEAYTDGIWLVELAALTDPALVPQSVTAVLGLHEEAGRSLIETLTEYLRSKTLLLLLDNCEHLVEACARLAETVLRSWPKVKIIETSRETFQIAGETTYRVPSLLLPDPAALPTTEKERVAALGACDSVRLFVERAKAHQPEFALAPQNGLAVAEICQRLEGIPLAIELAAGRINILSVAQINTRLKDRFRLLTTGSRTALPRQQTLRAAIDWSYDLLTAREQCLLRRLSVFAGGCTLEAAEAVTSDGDIPFFPAPDTQSPTPIEDWEILELLAQLVNKSLVIAEEKQGQSRYRLLETIRQYGGEKLVVAGEAAQMQARHRAFYLQFVEEAEAPLRGSEQALWLERLETEHDNVRQALETCQQEAEGVEAGLRIIGALWRFWEIRGHLSEGRVWQERILSQARETHRTNEYAKALLGAGRLAYTQGDIRQAQAHYEEARTLSQQLENYQGIAVALNGLGGLAELQHNPALARAYLEEGLRLQEQFGDKQAVAASLYNLGRLARVQEDYATAQTLHERALALDRELGDQRNIALSLLNLATVALAQSDWASARAFLGECGPIFQTLGDKQGVALWSYRSGELASGEGNYAEARTLYQRSLTLRWELQDKRGLAESLEELAGVVLKQAQPRRAVRLLAIAAIFKESVYGASRSVERWEDKASSTAQALALLGEEAFYACWNEGRTMPLEQAIAFALEESAA